MTNATSVFGDYAQFSKSNEVHIGNPHYYPSDKKELDGNAKKTALNPKYIDPPQRYQQTAYTIIGGEAGDVVSKIVPESLDSWRSFLDSSGSSKYNESWPVTEQSSASKLPDESSIDISKSNTKEHSVEDYLEKHKEDNESQGTLSKFVQRFREQPPLPRTERYSKKASRQPDFWWLSSPAHILSSTPISSDSLNLSPESNSIFSPGLSNKSSIFNLRGKEQKDSISTLLPEEESDSEIARMQLRTDKLLNLSESELKSRTTSHSSKTQYSLQTKHKKDNIPVNHFAQAIKTGLNNLNGSEKISLDLAKILKPAKAEDDILYKWRLSRKMNLAAQSASAPKSAAINYHSNSTQRNKHVSSLKKEGFTCQNTEKHKESSSETSSGNSKNEDHDVQDLKKSNDFRGHGPDENVTHKSHNESDLKHSNTCMKCKETQPESIIRHCHYHNCSINKSCVCREHVEYRDVCRCCTNTSPHVPPHTHDICDILPCVHRGSSDMLPQVRRGHTKLHTTSKRSQKNDERQENMNVETQQNNNEVVSFSNMKSQQNKDQISADKSQHKQTSKYTCDDTHKEKVENIEDDSCKNNIAPVIKQVISSHLFQRDPNLSTTIESLEHDVESLHNDKENFSLNIQHGTDSSSDDEFPNDEILRELWHRRRKNKNELHMVCERLKSIQAEKSEEEEVTVTRRMTK